MNSVRIFVFPSRPNSILVVAPEDATGLTLPRLAVPFVRGDVSAACSESGVDVRVSEAAPGRWTHAMELAAKNERSERSQREKLREARDASVLLGSNIDEIRERAEVLAKKQSIDADIARLKAQISQAKATAFAKGEYMSPSKFRGLTSRLDTLKLESQACQVRLSEIKKAEKDVNRKAYSIGANRFIDVAKSVLDPATFEKILTAANVVDDDDFDDEDDL